MSVRRSVERPKFHGIDRSGAIPVEYRFSHAQNGNRHLVVAFANGNTPDDFGFTSSLDNVRANILWIRDRFDGGQDSYYLCRDMDFAIESCVVSLIERIMNFLRLTLDDCTLIGSSKGASAALYFGLRHGFRNIIASAPQFAIGTILMVERPDTAQYMMGRETRAENVRILDTVIPDLVRSGANRGANIYLFSAPTDHQYGEQVEPYIGLFRGYQNFNFFLADTPSVTQHNDVTAWNLPLILGIVNLLADGITPRMGTVRHGNEDPDGDRTLIDGFVAATGTQMRRGSGAPVVWRPEPGQQLAGPVLKFTGFAPGAVQLSFWEQGECLGTVPSGGPWSWAPVRAWAPGEHVVEVFATDAEGTRSDGTVMSFTVLAALDAPVVTTPSADQQVVAVGGVPFSGTAVGASRVEFWQRGRRLGWAPVAHDASWSWTPENVWACGQHHLKVFAVAPDESTSVRTAVSFTVASPPPAALRRGSSPATEVFQRGH
ncbi:hypothetical protein [Streptomyces sp. NPDC001250]|uniref:hypothetical protein n=1 Tax=Streptomyces sp. NPDC001250 TaxID=3154382 RepID=UPI0033333C32